MPFRRAAATVIVQRDRHETLWKIDVIVSKASPFDQARFAQRRITEIVGVNVYAARQRTTWFAKLLVEARRIGTSTQ